MKKINVFLKRFLIIVFLSKLSACNIAAGSYPYAERYELNYSEVAVKNAINKFKNENPKYIVPKVNVNGQATWDLIDEQSSEPKHWYYVYFYYPKENQIIFTWTRPSGKGKTTLAFVSINQGLTIGNWKHINQDFNSAQNKEEKKKFEQLVLNKIKGYL